MAASSNTSRDTCIYVPASALRLQSCDCANPQESYISTAAKLVTALQTGHTQAGAIRFNAVVLLLFVQLFKPLQPLVLGKPTTTMAEQSIAVVRMPLDFSRRVNQGPNQACRIRTFMNMKTTPTQMIGSRASPSTPCLLSPRN